ncbi:uncharacterized protein LOC121052413 [Rosa chinensis]|uniref:uncharacterized protein LOC121052413 n=1 Tax=Rosa chinensis TaxID=74649 RepID=UPI001AD92C5A|nr:uncharacterized protein LOC121052413 [Rosa chinensis]
MLFDILTWILINAYLNPIPKFQSFLNHHVITDAPLILQIQVSHNYKQDDPDGSSMCYSLRHPTRPVFPFLFVGLGMANWQAITSLLSATGIEGIRQFCYRRSYKAMQFM